MTKNLTRGKRIAVIDAEGAAQLLVKRFPDPSAPGVQKIRADFIDPLTGPEADVQLAP